MSSIHEYLPETLKDVIDLKLLNEDLDIELEQLDGYITGIGNEVIVKSASLYGIEKWEKALGITPKDGDSLETRRFRVNNLLTSKLPYTYRWLIKKLTQITGSPSGYTLNINQDDYAITIVLSGLDTNMMIEVQKQLRNAIPSNMVLEIGGPPLVSADIKVGTALRIGTKYIIKSAKTGLPAGKNLLKNTTLITETTKNGITATPNKDGSITLNGTSTANCYFNLMNNNFGDAHFDSVTGGSTEYIASTSNSDTRARLAYDSNNKWIYLLVYGGNTLNNFVVKPMIRLASITDDTYEPFIEL